MSENKRCPDCKFAFRADLTGPYQCRRNPPNVTAFMVPGRLQGQAQIMTNASFPPVDATTWCGEFVDKTVPTGVIVVNGVRDPLVDDGIVRRAFEGHGR